MRNPKKELERSIIEAARRKSAAFPAAALFPFEEPDWLIPSSSVGIEVSELIPHPKSRIQPRQYEVTTPTQEYSRQSPTWPRQLQRKTLESEQCCCEQHTTPKLWSSADRVYA